MIGNYGGPESSLTAYTPGKVPEPANTTQRGIADPGSATDPEPGREGFPGEKELITWRRKATDILVAAAAVGQLPVFVLLLLGFGPPMGLLVEVVGVTTYVVILAAALLRRVEHPIRLSAFFSVAYVGIAVVNVALPHGPFAQVGLVILPVLALVLVGARAAGIAVFISALILATAPWLRAMPVINRMLGIDPALIAGSRSVVWMQAAVEMAFLLALMLLLDSFHSFLLDSLAAQSHAKLKLEQKAVEQSAVQRKMKREMQERRRLERELANMSDDERRRFGHDLHDGVCQQVTAALLRCQALEMRAERGGVLAGADVAPLSTLLAATLDEAHNVALGLCPLDAGPDALAPALRALTRRAQEMAEVQCEFQATGNGEVPDRAMAQHLYRIAQEALSNAVRHAHASRIAVELHGDRTELVLSVADNGIGLPDSPSRDGIGLRTMAYRAQMLESELKIGPALGGGTCVSCRVPRSPGTQAAQLN